MLADLRYAVRQLIGNRGFTAVALLTLAFGIGINTTTFTLVNAILYRMPPYRDPGRLTIIYGTMPQSQFTKLAPGNARDVVQQAAGFEGLTPWCWDYSNFAKPGEPAYRALGVQASGNFFSTLGIAPSMGRVFTPQDDHPGRNDVVVASERFWREKLGGNPNVVGSVIRLNGKSVTVIGVVSQRDQDLIYFGSVDLWQPLGYGENTWSKRDNDWLEFVARLKPGVSLEQARAPRAWPTTTRTRMPTAASTWPPTRPRARGDRRSSFGRSWGSCSSFSESRASTWPTCSLRERWAGCASTRSASHSGPRAAS